MLNHRQLGRTGLQVSEVALGTVELGMDYGIPVAGEHRRPAEEDAARLLLGALDAGVNFIDTARGYGESEAVIGRALRAHRYQYVLASKVSPQSDPSLTPQEVRERTHASIETSLRMLQTEAIDLLYIHSGTVEDIRRTDVLEAMLEARCAGKVRYVGASTYGEASALAAIEDGRYDCLQVAYNLADRSLEERVLPLALEHNIGVVVRSVLLKGALSHRYSALPDQLKDLKDAAAGLDALAQGAGMGLPEMAYRFVLAHPAVSSALVGTARPAELGAAIEYAQHGTLPPELQAAIRAVNVADRSQLHPGNWPINEAVWQKK